MNTVSGAKLKLAVIGIVACGSALLLLRLGPGGARDREESPGEGPARGLAHKEAGRSEAPTGESVVATPVRDDSSGGDPTGPARQAHVDAAATVVGVADLEELAEEQISKSSMMAGVRITLHDVQRTQDRVMDGWPEYAPMRASLLTELSREHSPADLSTDDLVRNVVTLREQFWKEGGNLSASAWKPGYKARLLAEIAAERAPENLAVIDELVETLQSVAPLYRSRLEGGRSVVDRELWQKLEDLRDRQFEQARKEIAAGRPPTLRDFVRGADLLYLVQEMPPNTQRSTEVVRYLKTMCRTSGWSKFLPTLDHVESTIEKQGCGYGFNIHVAQNVKFPDEYGYHRRLPSFRGPAERNMKLLEELP